MEQELELICENAGMPNDMKPGEHKTVQARILAYAKNVGWTFVSREEAEQRRGFDPDAPPKDRARGRSLFFDDLLDVKVRESNPRYAESEGALLGRFRHLHTDIYGNREFVEHLRNRGKFFDHEEKRERDLVLIDYKNPKNNVYEVTEEWAFHNGHYGTREDIVFLINGIPVLVIECKNANKDEAIALAVDQIRRYHRETPELFVSQQLFTATDAIGFSYGVSWNTVRRNIFNWKIEEPQKAQKTQNHGSVNSVPSVANIPGRLDRKIEKPQKARRKHHQGSVNSVPSVADIPGRLEEKIKSFCAIPQALAFDSEEINAIVKDLKLLKLLFKNKMESEAPQYLDLIQRSFDDKDVDTLIEHFRGPERRKEFFREYKEIEMLYEIISPDAFLRPYIGDYGTLSAIYDVVRKAYTKCVFVDRAFQQKTNELVQQHVGTDYIRPVTRVFEINEETVAYIASNKNGDGSKVINLVKSIAKKAEDESDDPYLIAMAERAQAVQEGFENRQTSTAEALAELLKEVEDNEVRKKEQAEKGFDGLTWFVYSTLLDSGIGDAEDVSRKIKAAFIEYPNWKQSENSLRELRKKVTFAIFAETEDLDRVAALVDELFTLLEKADQS